MDRSHQLWERACEVSPGGVHGAARYYEPYPRFFERAQGQFLWDVDGTQFLDLHGAWGTSALGYNDQAVRAAVIDALENDGVLLGAPHPREVQLAELLCERIPCADYVALCGGGGSDPLYFGYRLARSVTGKTRLLKFEGEYHGWHDPLAISVLPALRESGPERAPRPVPLSSGTYEGGHNAIIGSLNDSERLEQVFAEHGDEIACAVVEPVCHTSGCIPLDKDFLIRLRDLCTEHNVVLMFDEVLTGIRHSTSGAQALVGVTPDIAAFGKALGNGFAVSALVGRSRFMSNLTPLGGALYSGTYCGHLLSVVASIATVKELETRNVQEHTKKLTSRLASTLNSALEEKDINAVCQSFGSIFCLYFGTNIVRNYRDIATRPAAKRVNDLYQEALA